VVGNAHLTALGTRDELGQRDAMMGTAVALP
jgi:hypothetical protein